MCFPPPTLLAQSTKFPKLTTDLNSKADPQIRMCNKKSRTPDAMISINSPGTPQAHLLQIYFYTKLTSVPQDKEVPSS